MHHCTDQHSPADGTSPKGSGRFLLYSDYVLAKGLLRNRRDPEPPEATLA